MELPDYEKGWPSAAASGSTGTDAEAKRAAEDSGPSSTRGTSLWYLHRLTFRIRYSYLFVCMFVLVAAAQVTVIGLMYYAMASGRTGGGRAAVRRVATAGSAGSARARVGTAHPPRPAAVWLFHAAM